MKKAKRFIVMFLSLVTILSIGTIAVSATEKSVILTANKTYSLSDTMSAYGVYMVKGRTNNSESSSQEMRAHCHYRTGILSGWQYDKRVFIKPGKALSTNTYSTKFESPVTWRLGLSPLEESERGVSGNGVIISVWLILEATFKKVASKKTRRIIC